MLRSRLDPLDLVAGLRDMCSGCCLPIINAKYPASAFKPADGR